MINRVLIRLKIIQIVFAYYQNGTKNIDSAEKELFYSLSKAYDLYHYLLLLMITVKNYAKKHKPSTEKEQQSVKFIDNKFIAQLESNINLTEFVHTQKKTWDNEQILIKELYESIANSDTYQEYIVSNDSSFESDKYFWRKIYKQFIFNNELLDQVLEEQSLYWNDDKEIIDTFILKTIKRFDEALGAKQPLLPEYKDEGDKDFASRLFRRAVQNEEYYRYLINENAQNWDLERVAFMDIIIMQCALAEILSFPNIPISVSLNEYVDIAKVYSTAKSGAFVNGTLDGAVKRLKKEGKLNKS
ncbi:hypothetical protein EZS27_035376 [termite gut metagenome]|uniref:NusB/RsmB/TIM44 domain-containing protein n=1 Tax=termite gut metagenome TaxID=433724 RepID=A0A5J4PWC5_9ZZZZ